MIQSLFPILILAIDDSDMDREENWIDYKQRKVSSRTSTM